MNNGFKFIFNEGVTTFQVEIRSNTLGEYEMEQLFHMINMINLRQSINSDPEEVKNRFKKMAEDIAKWEKNDTEAT